MKVLVTGTRSGLGKYLFSEINQCYSFDRYTDINRYTFEFDLVIHCANEDTTEKNISLINELISKLKFKKFIFISSVVYKKDSIRHKEDEKIKLEDLDSDYYRGKFLVENIVKKLPNYLIMRVGGMVGKYSRWNNMRRMIDCKDSELSISPDSTFYISLYSDIYNFINLSIEKKLYGIYNCVPMDTVEASKVAYELYNNPKFGNYVYKTPLADNKKVSKLCNYFNKSSMANILKHVA